jgi:hypothetical protein
VGPLFGAFFSAKLPPSGQKFWRTQPATSSFFQIQQLCTLEKLPTANVPADMLLQPQVLYLKRLQTGELSEPRNSPRHIKSTVNIACAMKINKIKTVCMP